FRPPVRALGGRRGDLELERGDLPGDQLAVGGDRGDDGLVAVHGQADPVGDVQSRLTARGLDRADHVAGGALRLELRGDPDVEGEEVAAARRADGPALAGRTPAGDEVERGLPLPPR